MPVLHTALVRIQLIGTNSLQRRKVEERRGKGGREQARMEGEEIIEGGSIGGGREQEEWRMEERCEGTRKEGGRKGGERKKEVREGAKEKGGSK